MFSMFMFVCFLKKTKPRYTVNFMLRKKTTKRILDVQNADVP